MLLLMLFGESVSGIIRVVEVNEYIKIHYFLAAVYESASLFAYVYIAAYS